MVTAHLEDTLEQYVSLEQLVGGVGRLAESGSLSAPLLLVLVEMHTVCLSRHPLQRAITRYAPTINLITFYTKDYDEVDPSISILLCKQDISQRVDPH